MTTNWEHWAGGRYRQQGWTKYYPKSAQTRNRVYATVIPSLGQFYWTVTVHTGKRRVRVADEYESSLAKAKSAAEEVAEGVCSEPEQALVAGELGKAMGASEEEMQELRQEFHEGEERWQ